MAEIRPVSDLRNRFKDISDEVHKNPEGVILTKNGYADMVVVSYEEYNRRNHEKEVYTKLMEAELQARTSTERLSPVEAFAGLRQRVEQVKGEMDV